MVSPDRPVPQNPASDLVTVTVERGAGSALVVVTGDIDIVTAPRLRQAIHDLLAERVPVVVVDLLAVNFLASAGLGVLIDSHIKAGQHTRLRIVADGSATLRPLQITGLADRLSIFPTRADALAA